MLKQTDYGEVTRFDLARSLAGRGRYWTTCYYLDGLLIDTGCAHTAAELEAALSGRPLLRIVNTHTHEDHIGANGRLQTRRSGLPVGAHPLALPVLADPRRQQPLHPYRRVFWGWPTPCQASSLADGELIETDRFRLRVIFTPGHAPDHLCLFEERYGWLFSGDLFVGGRDRALLPTGDIWQLVASLKKVTALDVAALFPGSARSRVDPCPDLEGKIAFYEQQGARVLELHRQGCSVDQIVRRVCGGLNWIEVVTLGHFARKWLVLSYLKAADGGQAAVQN